MRTRRRLTAAGLGLTLLVACVFAACGGGSKNKLPADLTTLAKSEPSTTTTYVGKLAGTDAFVAVSDRSGKVTAYVCDSKALALWLSGASTGGAIKAASGPAALDASLSGDKVAGSVTLPDGTSHTFEAVKAVDESTGLFQARSVTNDDSLVRAGWIVLAGGEQRGGVKQGQIVSPVTSFSGQTAVNIGGTGAGAVSPPPPTTQASFCKTMRKLFKDLYNIYDKAKDAGEDTTGHLQAINDVLEVMVDEGCSIPAL